MFTPDNIKIYHADIKARTPARCNRRTGEIYININRWGSIPPEHRVFILLHEMGHIILNTSDEVAVDAWAQNQYIQAGYTLTDSVKALTQVLSGNSSEQIRRAEAQLNRARAMDGKPAQSNYTMNNPKSFQDMVEEQTDFMHSDSFLGIGGNKEIRKQKRAMRMERKQMRNDRKQAKNDKKQAKADAIRMRAEAAQTKADARLSLAEQGIVAPTTGGQIMETVGGIVKNVFGKGEQSQGGYIEEKPWYSTPGAIIGFVLGGIALMAGIFLLAKNARRNG